MERILYELFSRLFSTPGAIELLRQKLDEYGVENINTAPIADLYNILEDVIVELSR